MKDKQAATNYGFATICLRPIRFMERLRDFLAAMLIFTLQKRITLYVVLSGNLTR